MSFRYSGIRIVFTQFELSMNLLIEAHTFVKADAKQAVQKQLNHADDLKVESVPALYLAIFSKEFRMLNLLNDCS